MYNSLDYLTQLNESKINLNEYMEYLYKNKYYTVELDKIVHNKIKSCECHDFYNSLICENAIKIMIHLDYCNNKRLTFKNETIEKFLSTPKYFEVMQVKINNNETVYDILLKIYFTDKEIIYKLNTTYKVLTEIKALMAEHEYIIVSKIIRMYKIIKNSYYKLIKTLSSDDYTNIINVSVALCSLEYNGFQKYIFNEKNCLFTIFNNDVKFMIKNINDNIKKDKIDNSSIMTENFSLKIKNTVDFIINNKDLVYIYFNTHNVNYILINALIRSIFYSFDYKKNFSNIIIYDIKLNKKIKISIINPCIIYDLFTKLII